ncbi:MAG: hypothetical protein EBS99_07095, partial [Betaproteobacteria bacterium]|nr:hypothetical protein [Betaproteobacteria bacterium]
TMSRDNFYIVKKYVDDEEEDKSDNYSKWSICNMCRFDTTVDSIQNALENEAPFNVRDQPSSQTDELWVALKHNNVNVIKFLCEYEEKEGRPIVFIEEHAKYLRKLGHLDTLRTLMPCVFPVLALKVMGFARKGHQPQALRAHGLAYSAGVVLSFLALGGLMLSLRAAGESVGWGFQLQSPAMVAALAVLFTVIGLNLAGMFEFGQFLPSQVVALHARHPAVDAFLSGVLAVAVASPCTAPFMGASLGFAVTFSAPLALAVFAMLGVGMALPYLAASWWPALAARMPRPGPWMDHFRRLMAFPMFATVVWLVWVLGQQTGINGAGALLLLLVGLSLLVWTLTLSGRARIVLTGVALITGAALLYTVGPQVLREPALVSGPANPSAVTPGAAGATSDGWQPWSAARVDQLAAEGRAVFVDFTAAWCVTCQYNKQTTLSDPQVLQDFASKRVALLRADWTRRDPAITAALTQLGRSGVPVYVIYRAGQPPLVLPEILSVNEVRAELAKL